MKKLLALLPVLTALLLAACPGRKAGEEPFSLPPAIPPKILFGTSGIGAHAVGAVLHVDTERFNPLNAKDYIIRDRENPESDIQFFDTVVLAYAYLEPLPNGAARLSISPALQRVLDNSAAYIRPLRSRGIKVLIEIRSGDYADGEEGAGFGLGTIDRAAISATIQEITALLERYHIDGFEFNDIGGGYRAYPPYTRSITRFESDEPLYPGGIFMDENGNPLDAQIIEKILWLRGANNFADFMYFVYEALYERFRETVDIETLIADENRPNLARAIIARQNGHGAHLPIVVFTIDGVLESHFMVQNFAYIVQDFDGLLADIPGEHAVFYDEWREPWPYRLESGDSDRRFAPFILDLSNRLPVSELDNYRRFFTGGEAPPSKRYGALYFQNLPPVSEDPDVYGDPDSGYDSAAALTSYLTRLSTAVFGVAVRLAEGGGKH